MPGLAAAHSWVQQLTALSRERHHEMLHGDHTEGVQYALTKDWPRGAPSISDVGGLEKGDISMDAGDEGVDDGGFNSGRMWGLRDTITQVQTPASSPSALGGAAAG